MKIEEDKFMEFINGVNYVSDVSKITEVLFVIIWCFRNL